MHDRKGGGGVSPAQGARGGVNYRRTVSRLNASIHACAQHAWHSPLECRKMLSVEHACMLSLQACPTRKSSHRHACSKSCHLSEPPWGCMMVIIITMQCNAMQCNAMQCNAVQCSAMQCNAVQCSAIQCQAYLHWWASMLSSTIMMQTPLRSLPLLPARPLIWMYSPLFTHLFRHTLTVSTPEMQHTFDDSAVNK